MLLRFIRKNNRLSNQELYQKNNWYFVTICTRDRACIFTEIINTVEASLSRHGDGNGIIRDATLGNGTLGNGTAGVPLRFNPHKIWQKSFYDHIIRGGNDLQRIQEYILQNPLNW